MDPFAGAQDVHRCDLCETATVHSYCDICHVNLCQPCIGKHISDGYDKHKIVPFKQRKSTLIFPKCEKHPRKTCELQCKECTTFVCSTCMTSKQHKGHTFVEVAEVYDSKKAIIEKDKEILVKKISPSYEEIAQDLENQIANLDGGYEKLTTAMSKQGDEWHREIDAVVKETKTEINEIKEKHKGILQKHLDEIKQIQALIKQTLLALKQIEKTTEVSKTIDYSSKIEDFSKLPPKVQVTLPTFIPKPIDRKNMHSLFGEITPLSSATKKKVLSQTQPNASVRELLDEPKLLATVRTDHEILRSVACISEDKIWTSGNTNYMKCYNTKGSLLRTATKIQGQRPNDIDVDNDGDLLYINGATATVNKFKNGQAEEIINMPGWLPLSLCVTSTGDLLVTMLNNDNTECKAVRYSGSTKKQTIQFDDEGNSVYSLTYKMKFIAENKNHDICVADSGARAVVVVNQAGKLRWRYTGHPSTTKREPFKPYGITADSQGHILTADHNNLCIHILDHNGQFLRYIDNCDLKDPFGVCVDSNDNLFVCEYERGNVKKIKYLK